MSKNYKLKLDLKQLTWNHIYLSLALAVFSWMSISAGKPLHLDFFILSNGYHYLLDSYTKITSKQYQEQIETRLETLDYFVADKLENLGFEQDAKPYLSSAKTLVISDELLPQALAATTKDELISILGEPKQIILDLHSWNMSTGEKLQFNIDDEGDILNATIN